MRFLHRKVVWGIGLAGAAVASVLLVVVIAAARHHENNGGARDDSGEPGEPAGRMKIGFA